MSVPDSSVMDELCVAEAADLQNDADDAGEGAFPGNSTEHEEQTSLSGLAESVGFHTADETSGGGSIRSTRSRDNPEFLAKQKSFMAKVLHSSIGVAGDDEARPDTPGKRKRENSANSQSSAGGTKRKKTVKYDNNGQEIVQNDNYCWECHKEGGLICCEMCPRVFHVKCAGLEKEPDEDWACNECHLVMQAENVENRSRAMQLISVEQLCTLLKFALNRLKVMPGMEPFTKPVDVAQYPTYPEMVAHPVDFVSLEQNIRKKFYGSTEAFLVDTKWIVHNSVIFNGANSKVTSMARNLLKSLKQEMNEVEICPDCYMNAHQKPKSWFIEACRSAHPLIWARLKGFPFWPAKAVKWKESNVDVRFFGRHDRSWVPVKDCFLFSEQMPVALKKSNKNLDASIQEVNDHIIKLKERFGKFKYAPHRLPYNPLDVTQIKILLPNYRGLQLPHVKPQPKSLSRLSAFSDDETSSVASSESTSSSFRRKRGSSGSNLTQDNESEMVNQPGDGMEDEIDGEEGEMVEDQEEELEKEVEGIEADLAIKEFDMEVQEDDENDKEDTNEEDYHEECGAVDITVEKNLEVDEAELKDGVEGNPIEFLQRAVEEADMVSEDGSYEDELGPDEEKIRNDVETSEGEMEEQLELPEEDGEPASPSGCDLNASLDGELTATDDESPVDMVGELSEMATQERDDLMEAVKMVHNSVAISVKRIDRSTIERSSGGDKVTISLAGGSEGEGKLSRRSSASSDSPEEPAESARKGSQNESSPESRDLERQLSGLGSSISVKKSSANITKDKVKESLDESPKEVHKSDKVKMPSGVDTTRLSPSISITAVSGEQSRRAKPASNPCKPSTPNSSVKRSSPSTPQPPRVMAKPEPGSLPAPPPLTQQQMPQSIPAGNNSCSFSSPSPNSLMMQAMRGPLAGAMRMMGPCGPMMSMGMGMPRHLPPDAGPLSGQLHKYSHKLAEIMRSSLEEVLTGLMAGGAPEGRLAAVQLELERTNWRHQQELAEVRHNADLMIVEMRGSLEAEKQRAIEELRRQTELQMGELRRQAERQRLEQLAEMRRQAEVEKQRAVEETKRKQWCAACGKEALFFCCWNTSYCDYPCQQSHWPQHMSVCGQNSDTGVDGPSESVNGNASGQSSGMSTPVPTVSTSQYGDEEESGMMLDEQRRRKVAEDGTRTPMLVRCATKSTVRKRKTAHSTTRKQNGRKSKIESRKHNGNLGAAINVAPLETESMSPKMWMDWFYEQAEKMEVGPKTKQKGGVVGLKVAAGCEEGGTRKKRKSTPCVRRKVDHILSPAEVTEEMLSRVATKPKDKIHDQGTGTSCHQCRQKTSDTKTICRSGKCVGLRGFFCGPCLRTRYGEDARKALLDPDWLCPVCRGICNCSLCRKSFGLLQAGLSTAQGIGHEVEHEMGYTTHVQQFLELSTSQSHDEDSGDEKKLQEIIKEDNDGVGKDVEDEEGVMEVDLDVVTEKGVEDTGGEGEGYSEVSDSSMVDKSEDEDRDKKDPNLDQIEIKNVEELTSGGNSQKKRRSSSSVDTKEKGKAEKDLGDSSLSSDSEAEDSSKVDKREVETTSDESSQDSDSGSEDDDLSTEESPVKDIVSSQTNDDTKRNSSSSSSSDSSSENEERAVVAEVARECQSEQVVILPEMSSASDSNDSSSESEESGTDDSSDSNNSSGNPDGETVH